MISIRSVAFGTFLLAGLLSGCSTPQNLCLRDAQAELRALDQDIAETERALALGYRMTEAAEARTTLHICAWPREPVLFCTRHTPGESVRRKPVDRVTEEARLDNLRARRPGVLARTEVAIAACRTS